MTEYSRTEYSPQGLLRRGWNESGALVHEMDDATRTVTTYDGTPTTRPYTAEEDAAADAALAAGARLDDLTPPNWWMPNALLTDTDGTVYRNTSNTILTTPPSEFPGGGISWRGDLFVVVTTPEPDPDPDPTRPAGYVGPWSADADYTVGNVVDRNGRYYQCDKPHGAAYMGTWGPPATGVWTDIGAV